MMQQNMRASYKGQLCNVDYACTLVCMHYVCIWIVYRHFQRHVDSLDDIPGTTSLSYSCPACPKVYKCYVCSLFFVF